MLLPFSGQHIESYFYMAHKAEEISPMYVTKAVACLSRLPVQEREAAGLE